MAFIRFGARYEHENTSTAVYLTGFHSAANFGIFTDGSKLPPPRMSMYGSADHQYNPSTCAAPPSTLAGGGLTAAPLHAARRGHAGCPDHVAFGTDDIIALFYQFRDMYTKLPWHDATVNDATPLSTDKALQKHKAQGPSWWVNQTGRQLSGDRKAAFGPGHLRCGAAPSNMARRRTLTRTLSGAIPA